MDKDFINALLQGATLGRINKQTFQGAMLSVSTQEPENLLLTQETLLHIHFEAQTYLLLRILEELEAIHGDLKRRNENE